MAFTTKCTITVTSDAALLPSTQTDFPVLCYLSDPSLKSLANGGSVTDAQGDDIVFHLLSDLSDAAMSYELVSVDLVNGIAEFWVKKTVAIGDLFYAGIGDSGITTFQGGSTGAAWNSAFKDVLHLPNGSSLTASDSTANGNDGTISGASAVAAKIDGGASFNGSTDAVTLAGISSAIAFTLSAWIYPIPSSTDYAPLITQLVNSGLFYHGSTKKLNFYYGGSNYNNTALTENAFTNIQVTYSGSTLAFYLNGAADGTSTIVAASFNADTVGSYSGFALKGYIDELRVSSVASSADWIKADYYQYPSSGFIAQSYAANSIIASDANSNSGYQAAASSYSWNHTCAGSNRYLTVGISMLSLAQSVSGITYNGVALTLLGVKNSISGACRIELWGLVAPATGTNSIAVTLTGAIASAGNASSYTGVHQTNSTEAFNSAQATNIGAADATMAVTTVAADDWVVDTVATDDAAITVGAGQTQTGNVTGAGGSGAMSYEPATAPAAVTMSWTNVGALATWSIGGIALRPTTASIASGGGGPIVGECGVVQSALVDGGRLVAAG